jgi:phosphate/sulfate permease
LTSTILSASIGRCKAQQASNSINLTALIVSIAATLVIVGIVFLILGIILYLTCNKWLAARKQQRTRQMAVTLAQRSTIDPSAAEAQPEGEQSQTTGNFNTSTNSTAGSNPAEYHSSYSQSQSSGTSHPVIAASETTALQCQVTTPEAISLPEATLHQGEEPPAYAEAIEMKTVRIVGCR